MPKGLSKPSSVVAIGFDVTETAANTFTQGQVDLNLSALDREVFVVLAIDLDPSEPDAVLGTNTAVSASLTSTSQTGIQNLSNANCMATARLAIRAAAGETAPGASFSRQSSESPASMLDYLGIIATNDFFVQVEGTGNTNVRKVSGKLYGYRAEASADIYAALVQSEVLSA
jgi:hypothetical protein